MKMADKKKSSEESKTGEIKEMLSEVKETVKEKFEDCKEKASEGVDAVKEKTSEVVETVKGEGAMLVTFALLAAWGSGCLAHKGGDTVPAAVLLGGKNSSVLDFFRLKISRCFLPLCLGWRQQPIQEEEVETSCVTLLLFCLR